MILLLPKKIPSQEVRKKPNANNETENNVTAPVSWSASVRVPPPQLASLTNPPLGLIVRLQNAHSRVKKWFGMNLKLFERQISLWKSHWNRYIDGLVQEDVTPVR